MCRIHLPATLMLTNEHVTQPFKSLQIVEMMHCGTPFGPEELTASPCCSAQLPEGSTDRLKLHLSLISVSDIISEWHHQWWKAETGTSPVCVCVVTGDRILTRPQKAAQAESSTGEVTEYLKVNPPVLFTSLFGEASVPLRDSCRETQTTERIITHP